MQVPKPEDALLVGLALVAALFFIGGLIDAFRVPSHSVRRRRSKLGRRKPKTSGLTELLEEWTEAESPPAATAARTPETTEPIAAPVISTSFKAAWPARPAAPTVTPHQATVAPAQHPDLEQFLPDETDRSKIVVHYANGKILKGYSYDFHPQKPHFHLLPPVAGFSFTDEAIEVRIKNLKAIFFVRDFDGDPFYNERKEFAEGERPPGRKVKVTFEDGEVLTGSTLGYDPHRQGFFFLPVDPKSNNVKVFAVRAAVTSVRFL